MMTDAELLASIEKLEASIHEEKERASMMIASIEINRARRIRDLRHQLKVFRSRLHWRRVKRIKYAKMGHVPMKTRAVDTIDVLYLGRTYDDVPKAALSI